MKVKDILTKGVEKITKKDCENIELIGQKINEIIEHINIIDMVLVNIVLKKD